MDTPPRDDRHATDCAPTQRRQSLALTLQPSPPASPSSTVYTNWIAVDEFMHQFIDTLERHACAAGEKRSVTRVRSFVRVGASFKA